MRKAGTNFLLQFFNLNLVFFNFPAKTLAEELEFLTGASQAETSIVSSSPSLYQSTS
jgi:hypothetical protein